MTFGDRMKEFMGQGLQVSKDFMTKAGAKAQDLGEKGVLHLEIKQLEGQAQRLIAKLGAEVYSDFTEKGVATVSAEDPAVKALIAELEDIKVGIDKREAELKEGKNR